MDLQSAVTVFEYFSYSLSISTVNEYSYPPYLAKKLITTSKNALQTNRRAQSLGKTSQDLNSISGFMNHLCRQRAVF